jgi:hypothetical protein
VCRSPALFAAYRALHRLCVPRHPPHTFVRLTRSQPIHPFGQQTGAPLVQIVQAKHALFRTSDALTEPQISRSAESVLRLTEVLRPRCHADLVTSFDGHVAGRSTHDHFPLPLSNSGPGPKTRATKSSRDRDVRDGRQNPGLSWDPPKRPATHRSGKEVIQPQVPLRLPCYDFAPVIALALGGLVPCGFRHRLRALTTSMA